VQNVRFQVHQLIDNKGLQKYLILPAVLSAHGIFWISFICNSPSIVSSISIAAGNTKPSPIERGFLHMLIL